MNSIRIFMNIERETTSKVQQISNGNSGHNGYISKRRHRAREHYQFLPDDMLNGDFRRRLLRKSGSGEPLQNEQQEY